MELYCIGLGANVDIDDANRAEQALQRSEKELHRSEKELREVIDAIPTIAWTALPDGSNAYVNKRFVEYSGLSAEQASGSGWQTATHPDDLEQHLSRWMASVATGEPFENEIRFRRTDGHYRWRVCRGVVEQFRLAHPALGQSGRTSFCASRKAT